MVAIKRVYDPAAPQDGTRVLVDGLWPRGLSRAAVACDEWRRDIAPSAALRKWYGHRPERHAEFERRYRAELAANEGLAQLRRQAREGPLTLLTATRDLPFSHAETLRKLLSRG